MTQPARTKRPDEVLDWTWDWTEWLEGDTIATSSFTADPGITTSNPSHDTTSATIRLSGGTDGSQYDITNHVTSTNGRAADKTLTIHVGIPQVRTVVNTLTSPGGNPLVGKKVSIRLNVGGFTGDGTVEVLSTRYVITDADGTWACDLDVNDSIDPADTYYTVSEARGVVWAFVVPAGSGAVTLRDCLVDAPPNTDPVEVVAPGLATVATSGSYTDLTNTPTLGTAAAHPATDFDSAGAAAAAQAAAIAAAATDATTKANAAQAAAIAASQPVDSDLTAIAALSTTSFGRGLLALADAAAGRTALGLGTAATQASAAFDAAGAAAAAQAASQPVDTDLTAIAALSTTTFGRALLTMADAATTRTNLGLGTAATQAATAFEAAGAVAAKTLADVATTATANGALVIGKHNPVDATSGNLTMTLADAASAGQVVAFSKKDATANTIALNVAHLRDAGAGTVTLFYQYESIVLVSKADGTWWPIGGHRTKASLDAVYAPTGGDVTAPAATGNLTTDTAAVQAALDQATTTGGRLILRRGDYLANLVVTADASNRIPIIIGQGEKHSTIRSLVINGVSGSIGSGYLADFGFNGGGHPTSTVALDLVGCCGVTWNNLGFFGTSPIGIRFYNRDAGQFTEHCRGRADFNSSVATPVKYQVDSGSNSFEGSGLTGGSAITQATTATTPSIDIGAGAYPHLSPMDVHVWVQKATQPVIKNAGVARTNFKGDITIELLGVASGILVDTAQNTVALNGSLTGQGIDIGALDTTKLLGAYSRVDIAQAGTVLDYSAKPPRILVPVNGGTGVSATAWTSIGANKAIANRVTVQVPGTYRYINYKVDVASGNIQVGLIKFYDPTNPLLYTVVASTGVIACPTAGNQRADLGSQFLLPGEYGVFMWADNTTFQTRYASNSALDAMRTFVALSGITSGVTGTPNAFAYGTNYLAAISLEAA